MREESASTDAAVARIAARQHGVVSLAQLRAAGVDKSAVSRKVGAGRLHRVHRGVYAVGHAGLSLAGRWMAAVLACGEGAVLSHRSAAALWGLLTPMSGAVEVSVPSQGGRRPQRGIRLHRCASLTASGSTRGALATAMGAGEPAPSFVTVRCQIPVTSVPRTIGDLRDSVTPRLFRRAVRQAEIAGFALGPGVKTDRTRSDFEGDFLALCERHGFPRPEVNVRVGRWTVDFLWRAARLAVETDSYRYHRGTVAFEDDHARDLELRRYGFEVRRFTERQIRDEADRVAADLTEALSGP